MKGELFLPNKDKPEAILDCQIAEYREPDDPDHSVRIVYTYEKRPKPGLELYKDVPLRLRLDDGRETSVILQHEATTPDGRITGVLRVVGEWS